MVFDKDGHQNISSAFHEADSITPKIHIAFTVTCFEFFVLLHFKKTTKAFNKCDDVIQELKQYFPGYEKASNLFKSLEDRINEGVENSKWCKDQYKSDLEEGKKPYTFSCYSNIHELIDCLYSLISYHP